MNATQAAIRAGYELPAEAAGFYVYLLCDSRDGRIFYVGKGKGKRRFAHAKEANKTSAKLSSPRKLRRILEIQGAGGEVECPVFSSGLEEEAALGLERALIGAIGKENLTNHSSGMVTASERRELSREKFKLMLRRLRPLDEWMSIPAQPHGLWNDSNGRAEFYLKFRSHLERGAEL